MKTADQLPLESATLFFVGTAPQTRRANIRTTRHSGENDKRRPPTAPYLLPFVPEQWAGWLMEKTPGKKVPSMAPGKMLGNGPHGGVDTEKIKDISRRTVERQWRSWSLSRDMQRTKRPIHGRGGSFGFNVGTSPPWANVTTAVCEHGDVVCADRMCYLVCESGASWSFVSTG